MEGIAQTCHTLKGSAKHTCEFIFEKGSVSAFTEKVVLKLSPIQNETIVQILSFEIQKDDLVAFKINNTMFVCVCERA